MAVLSSLIDAVAAPILGRISDLARHAGVTRAVFALVGSLPLAGATLAVFALPAEWLGQRWIATWALLWNVLLRLSMTAVEVAHQALGVELTADYDARSRLVAVREGLGVLGTVFSATLPAALSGFGIRQAFGWIAAGHAIVLVASCVICMLATSTLRIDVASECKVSPIAVLQCQVLDSQGKFRPRAGSTRALIFGKGGDSVRALLWSQGLATLGAAMNASTFAFFVPQVLFQPGQMSFDPGGVLLGAYVLVAALSIPFWVRLGSVVEKSTALIFSCILQGMGFFAIFVLCGRGPGGRGGLVPYSIFGLTSGVGMAGSLIFPSSMRADICTQDEFHTGQRREGQIEGLFGLVSRGAGTLGVVLALLALSSSGFQEGLGSEQQSEQVRLVLSLVYGGIPGLAILAAIVPLMRGYSLDRCKQKNLTSMVDSRREEA